jgi:mannose-6-phosphate isomerase-like protein (cupin superfamily)
MARSGDEIVNPVTGHRIVFRKTARDTDGELLQMDWIGGSGWRAGPVHVHSFQEERFEVLSGTLGSHVAGVERAHGPADGPVVVPAGVEHTVWNAGDGEVHALVDFRPASIRTETMLETVFGLAQDGKLARTGIPRNPLRLALIVHDYEDQIYLARPPLAMQRVLFGALASVGRLLGYRAEYPYPYGSQGEKTARLGGERVEATSRVRKGAVVIVAAIFASMALFLLRRRRRGER